MSIVVFAGCQSYTDLPASVTKAVFERSSAKEAAEKAQSDVKVWQEALEKQYSSSFASLAQQLQRSEHENADMLRRTQGVLDELNRYKRAMRNYAEGIP